MPGSPSGAFAAFLAPLRKTEWVVYAKKRFAVLQALLAYLSRYTHRVAISNRRLISADETRVTFTWKDYRVERPGRYKTMTLATHEFIRRFLIHVLPKGLHRIRDYGLFANGNRAANIARARELLAVPSCSKSAETSETTAVDEPRVLPLPAALRRPHDHHRDLRGPLSAKTSPRDPDNSGSASILHDAITCHPSTQRRSPFRLAPRPAQPPLTAYDKSRPSGTANSPRQRPLLSFRPSLTPVPAR
jgi:Putative transposase